MRPTVRHQAAGLWQRQHQFQWRAWHCGAASGQGQPDAAHLAEGAGSAGKIGACVQNEPRGTGRLVQRCCELCADWAIVEA